MNLCIVSVIKITQTNLINKVREYIIKIKNLPKCKKKQNTSLLLILKLGENHVYKSLLILYAHMILKDRIFMEINNYTIGIFSTISSTAVPDSSIAVSPGDSGTAFRSVPAKIKHWAERKNT